MTIFHFLFKKYHFPIKITPKHPQITSKIPFSYQKHPFLYQITHFPIKNTPKSPQNHPFSTQKHLKTPKNRLKNTIFLSKIPKIPPFSHLIRTGNPPILQLDFHGHSRKKDIFIYGNNNKNHRRERVNGGILGVFEVFWGGFEVILGRKWVFLPVFT
jgi:hypothetical protein